MENEPEIIKQPTPLDILIADAMNVETLMEAEIKTSGNTNPWPARLRSRLTAIGGCLGLLLEKDPDNIKLVAIQTLFDGINKEVNDKQEALEREGQKLGDDSFSPEQKAGLIVQVKLIGKLANKLSTKQISR